MNVACILDEVVTTDPDRAALIIDDVVVSYADLAAVVLHCASELSARGVVAGDRVAVADVGGLLPLAVILGAARIGAAAAPVNVKFEAPELRERVQAAGCCGVAVAGDASRDALGRAVDGVVLGPDDLLDVTHTATARGTKAVALVDDDTLDALVLFTSGTTGRPKAVPMSHGVLSRRLASMSVPFDATQPPVVVLTSVSAFHIGGAFGLLLALRRAQTSVVLPRFDAGEWLRLVARHHVESAFVWPRMLQQILDHPDFAATDLTGLRAIPYGSAAAPVELVTRAMAALPHVAFSNTFGQTETLGVYATLTPEDHLVAERIGSVGRAHPGVELRIVDPDTRADVPDGELGELWVLSDQNVRAGWLRTGDLARRDADGYVYPAGRLSETIVRDGERILPGEIERVLRAHPSVADVAAAGIPDPQLGARVGVAIVAAAPMTPAEVTAFCAERLTASRVPDHVVFTDELPYGDTGKVAHRRLVALIESQAMHSTGPWRRQ